MSDSNYSKIFTGSSIIANQIVIALQNVDINAIVKDETESGRLAGFGGTIAGNQEIFVHLDELHKAKDIVKTIMSKIT